MTDSNKESYAMVDDTRLFEDETGEYKEELLATLDGYAKEVRAELRKGCRQEDYNLYNELLPSIEVAQKVIINIWKVEREKDTLEKRIGASSGSESPDK